MTNEESSAQSTAGKHLISPEFQDMKMLYGPLKLGLFSFAFSLLSKFLTI